MNRFIELLVEALRDPKRRTGAIAEFQQLVWNAHDLPFSAEASEVIDSLAHDLDYYVHDEVKRREDPAYYGNDRVVREIIDALEKLRQCGVEIPSYR